MSLCKWQQVAGGNGARVDFVTVDARGNESEVT